MHQLEERAVPLQGQSRLFPSKKDSLDLSDSLLFLLKSGRVSMIHILIVFVFGKSCRISHGTNNIKENSTSSEIQ